MLPNLKNTIKRFSQKITYEKTTSSVVNHELVETSSQVPEMAVVQPADMNTISKEHIDYSLRYVGVHSLFKINENDKIIHNGVTYRAFKDSDFSDYGFFKTIMEEVK